MCRKAVLMGPDEVGLSREMSIASRQASFLQVYDRLVWNRSFGAVL